MKQPLLSPDDVQTALASPDGPRWELMAGKLVKVVRCSGVRGRAGLGQRRRGVG